MKAVSGSQLADLTGKTWRTVKRLLDGAGISPLRREGPAYLYDSAAALAAIYARATPDGNGLDLTVERARLASEQADRLAIQNAITRGEIGRLSVWQHELEGVFLAIRAGVLSLPTRLAPQMDCSLNERKARLETACRDILRAIAEYQPGRGAAGDDLGDLADVDGAQAAADVDGEPVVRRVPKAKPRKRRRTRAVADK